ncbi:MAG: ABC transporter ATP-binding protein [Candidatus Kapabacteria bacterium]|nr:ABC transporter ATP-binding protein [Candidatus Kapabacteria bacterium]
MSFKIELINIHKSYKEGLSVYDVLKGINLSLSQGEIVILLGKSGSGKSTLLNLISGIDLPDKGEIIVDDLKITEQSEHNRTLYRRKKIGFIFQFFNLIPTLTVEENLLLPYELNFKNTNGFKEKANELLEEVGLLSRWKSYPDILSGGEQQRIAIARALIHNPDIILADEPTGNLDYENGKAVINLLDNLVRKNNKTLIMATHSREVIGIADRILQIKDGSIQTLNPN